MHCKKSRLKYWLKMSLSMREVLGSTLGLIKSDAVACDISSELCCPGAKPQR